MGEMGPHYEANSNVTAAKNLKGHLYLTVGELDTNVDPSSTFQVVNALIAAGKDFDLLVTPNGGHGATGPDGTRRRNDFFVRWLLGVNPPDWNSGITLRQRPAQRVREAVSISRTKSRRHVASSKRIRRSLIRCTGGSERTETANQNGEPKRRTKTANPNGEPKRRIETARWKIETKPRVRKALRSAREAATVKSIAMTKRRYGDEEVREIFSLATTGGGRDPSLPANPAG